MKNFILGLITVVTLALVPAMSLSVPAFADNPNNCGDSNKPEGQILQGIGETGNNCDPKPVTNAFARIVEILSIIAGFIAVVMIIVGGVRYMTSGGDSGKVSNAKSTLLYALIGLAIAALAQFLVHFVLFRTKQATTSSVVIIRKVA